MAIATRWWPCTPSYVAPRKIFVDVEERESSVEKEAVILQNNHLMSSNLVPWDNYVLLYGLSCATHKFIFTLCINERIMSSYETI